MLDITPSPTTMQLAEWETLSDRDREFIAALLSLMANNINEIQLNKLKLNQPIEHWYQLLTTMTQSFNNK